MPESGPFLLITPTTSEYKPVKMAAARWLAEGSVRLEMCGIGPDCAGEFAGHLSKTGPWSGLALIGWAGGVSAQLAPGDIVLAEGAVDDEGRQAPCTVIHLPGAASGTLLTVREPLLTAESKNAAQRNGVLAVEMEAYPLAAWAAEQAISFIHARVILDSVDDALPGLGGALDPYGRIRPGSLVRLLVARPHLGVELWPMAQRLRMLRPILGSLAFAISRAWLERGPASTLTTGSRPDPEESGRWRTLQPD